MSGMCIRAGLREGRINSAQSFPYWREECESAGDDTCWLYAVYAVGKHSPLSFWYSVHSTKTKRSSLFSGKWTHKRKTVNIPEADKGDRGVRFERKDDWWLVIVQHARLAASLLRRSFESRVLFDVRECLKAETEVESNWWYESRC